MNFEVLDGVEVFAPKKINKKVCGTVTVPGSKSMTNRALLLAALSKEKSLLRGVLFSDDSRHFLSSLESLGFELSINEDEKTVEISGCGGSLPKKSGTIDVGSAGTAARFLTAMLALSDGEYTIECSTQMEKRPMAELFRVLTDMGASFEYLKEPEHLPCKVVGNGGKCQDITMDISKSTQFLSAMLMVTPVTKSGINITITSEKKTGSYIGITMDMLKSFGVETSFDGSTYHVSGNQYPVLGDYYIEPDVSGACYFWALAAMSGGEITVSNVFYSSVQGDMKFLTVLEKMGATVTETKDGIKVTGPDKLKGVQINMNDFSDQALTLAAMAAFAEGSTEISGIAHIKAQECDRMEAIVHNLTSCGLEVSATEDSVTIIPGQPDGADLETYDDHRVAMSFSLLALFSNGVRVKDPRCCRKTFENFYEVLEDLL